MNPADRTQSQSAEQQQRARQMSLSVRQPPARIAGYAIDRFLGSGAFGEVWVGLDQNTGRQVAIKFYTHRGGLDWSLLSREVEKLVYLSADRYVVQLLVVGWEAEPPYYVMEYIEHGSLDDYLQARGSLPLGEALDLFREIAIGLSHAHAKGVLHCDLKPANILLDQDAKPRLADFGQSRLSHEQTPSLGTLFYMAPEQADLDAVPDARWDVYALGSLLYAALVGSPPHRTPEALERIDQTKDLPERLSCYRRLLRDSPPPSRHRKVRGMDKPLASIIDRCLAGDPQQRYSTVEAVLAALEQREQTRHRRPLLVMGLIGPLLLLAIMLVFGWRSYERATRGRVDELRRQASEVTYFAARTVAGVASDEIASYLNAVQAQVQPELLDEIERLTSAPEVAEMLAALADPNTQDPAIREQFVAHPLRAPLQNRIDQLVARQSPKASSWFVCDRFGTQLASAFVIENRSTIGMNYRWRTYFHGGPSDLKTRQGAGYHYGRTDDHLTTPHLSAPFRSQATDHWKVAMSVPLKDRQGAFAGVLALTVELRELVPFEENTPGFFAVLIDGREGDRQGMILKHPLFDDLVEQLGRLPERLDNYRVKIQLERPPGVPPLFQDPMGDDPLGGRFRRPWLAAQAELPDTGLVIQIQQDYPSLVAPVRKLGYEFLRLGIGAATAVVLVVVLLWTFVLRAASSPSATMIRPSDTSGPSVLPTPVHQMTTLMEGESQGRDAPVADGTSNSS